MLKQKTLKGSFTLNGKGLHTGVKLTVTFNPAPEHHGYKIQRIDLDDQPIIDAIADNVVDTTRGTVLAKNGVKVSTVEHAMAALYAAGIDNCLIQVNGPELPILDGSSKAYVECIQRVGIEEQTAPKDYYIIKSKIEVRDEETGSSIIVLPDDKFSLNVLISYDSKILTNQYATLENMDEFPTEIASARTFVFVREIEPLLNAGLIKGGDLDNAIVIYEKQMTQENFDKLADVMRVPHMDASHLGYINHIPLVWPNEPARHKLLDIIGDLAVTSNEPFFQGHFPQEPVMPGVLQVEAMAQVGGLLVLNSLAEPERYSTYFLKIDNVKFRQKVVPGDTLVFRVELLAPIRRGISTMKGYIFVGEKIVCEAEFMAQIVKNK